MQKIPLLFSFAQEPHKRDAYVAKETICSLPLSLSLSLVLSRKIDRALHVAWWHTLCVRVSDISFAEYSLFYRALLQKRPIILRSLPIVATPYTLCVRVSDDSDETLSMCAMTLYVCHDSICVPWVLHVACAVGNAYRQYRQTMAKMLKDSKFLLDFVSWVLVYFTLCRYGVRDHLCSCRAAIRKRHDTDLLICICCKSKCGSFLMGRIFLVERIQP